MAQESYRPPPVHAYARSESRERQAESQPSARTPHTMAELERRRTRESSNADAHSPDSGRYNSARQPINDAIASALHNSDNSVNAISPDVLSQLTSQITANVIQQLKASNLPAAAPSQSPPTLPAMATSPSNSGSPTMDHRKVYTPPSPYRPSEEPVRAPVSPVLAPSKPAMANHGRVRSPQAPDRRAASPASQASQADEADTHDRPRGPRRLSTGADATILEKIWGTLFNEQGQPMPKLGQFLRGIAVHLIEDYEPKQSLVITPDKMQRYYEDTRGPSEVYPWQDVFDDKTSSISRLFRELEIQHHLVQEKPNERPEIPGLTPQGFETWVTLLLLAHPDEEFERLQKTALDMPISNPDDKKERFPKEISRRLFPGRSDGRVVEKLQKAITNHCNLTVTPKPRITTDGERKTAQASHRGTTDAAPAPFSPPLSKQSTQPEMPVITPATSRHDPPPSATYERERKPYSSVPSENAMSDSAEDEHEVATPQPIERERKPYVAQPGGGKTYDDYDRGPTASSVSYPPPAQETRPRRSASITSSGRPTDLPKSRPIPITVHQRPVGPNDGMPMSADARHHRADSMYSKEGSAPTGRLRSPSASQDYGHRSEGDVSYGSYGAGLGAPPMDMPDDQRRRREFDRVRERHDTDRYDAARMAAYDPRDREREARPRYQSTLGGDPPRAHYLPDEDYVYRASGGGYQTGRDGYGYPPNSYR